MKIYDGSTLLAKLGSSRLGFYSNGSEVFYIQNGKLNAAGDLEIKSGETLKIVSGGAMDVNTTNFKIDSASQLILTGAWELSQYGLRAELPNNIEFYLQNVPTNTDGVTMVISESSFTKWGTLDFKATSDGMYVTPATDMTGQVGTSSCRFLSMEALTMYANAFTQRSSRNVKKNIRKMPDMGGKLDELEPVTFIYNDDKEERTRSGLIWEDTVQVMPEICTEKDGQKAIMYTDLIPVMLKEIQQLRARVKELERRQDNNGDHSKENQ